ncbi:protein PFC0760c-like isoform X2 [Cotesia glomerata]|uniref:Uncharacterized protein n=1 Tax=Cotesia glomerata TaxID=32391 RepID=A0AAV7J1A3_COTGL|nr:protein PFC0760c-like isoform X2 [Cotesia glomerata]KAH0561011.1 hypothetical protein KQX54_011064 [Cotesia glomerata]
MSYKSIDNVGSRQLRNRLRRLRECVNDVDQDQIAEHIVCNRNEEIIFPAVEVNHDNNDGMIRRENRSHDDSSSGDDDNFEPNFNNADDIVQNRNEEVIFPALEMNHDNNYRVLFRPEDMRPRENELNGDDNLGEDVFEQNFNNDDHNDVEDDEYENENEDPEYVHNRNQENNNNNINQNQPLFDGAPLTVGDSMLVILSLILLCHNLSMACVEDVIKAIELHCIPHGLKKNSLHKFKKYFQLDETEIIKHYYCKFCTRELVNKNEECPSCVQKKKLLLRPVTNYNSAKRNV